MKRRELIHRGSFMAGVAFALLTQAPSTTEAMRLFDDNGWSNFTAKEALEELIRGLDAIHEQEIKYVDALSEWSTDG